MGTPSLHLSALSPGCHSVSRLLNCCVCVCVLEGKWKCETSDLITSACLGLACAVSLDPSYQQGLRSP